jgi:hypothetical protein
MHAYDQGDPGDGELMGANYYVDHDQATHQGGRLRGHDQPVTPGRTPFRLLAHRLPLPCARGGRPTPACSLGLD